MKAGAIQSTKLFNTIEAIDDRRIHDESTRLRLDELLALITPHAPVANTGRPPFDLVMMLVWPISPPTHQRHALDSTSLKSVADDMPKRRFRPYLVKL